MKGLRLTIITLLAVWLEVSFLGAWRPFGVIPDLLIIVVLATISSSTRASDILAMAMGGGFLLDLASGIDFGLRTAFFCFLGLLGIIIRRTGADFDRLSLKLAAVVSATILYDAVVLVSLLSSHGGIAWGAAVRLVIIQLLVNVGLWLLLDWPLHRVISPRRS